MKNKEIIENFYKNWIDKNIEGLKEIYHQEVVFDDPVFKNLNYKKTIQMWKMLFTVIGNKEEKVNATYKIISDEENKIVVEDIVKYKINGNKVVNVITSKFIINDNKIISHIDTFDFKKWLNQSRNIKTNKSNFYYWVNNQAARFVMNRKLKKIKI